MSNLKQKVSLSPEDAAALRALNDKMQGVQAWVSAVSQQGERRIAELTQEGRELWMRLGKTYEIDITKQNYDLDTDGESLVLKSARFV